MYGSDYVICNMRNVVNFAFAIVFKLFAIMLTQLVLGHISRTHHRVSYSQYTLLCIK